MWTSKKTSLMAQNDWEICLYMDILIGLLSPRLGLI